MNVRFLRIFTTGLVAALIVGCNYDRMSSSLVPEAESQYAQDFLQRLQDRDFEYVKSQIDESMVTQITDEKLVEIADYFPSGEQLSVELIGSRSNTINSGWKGNFTFEYQIEGGWAVASTAMQRVDGKTAVTGFSVYQTPASQRELTAFSTVDVTPTRIIMLFMTVAVSIFMIFTCVMVYRTPIPAKKKRWYFISFVGVFGFTFNWATEALNHQLLTVKLFGFGISAAGHAAPWILKFTIPMGAILFWIMRKELMNQPGPDNEPDEDSPSSTEDQTKQAN